MRKSNKGFIDTEINKKKKFDFLNFICTVFVILLCTFYLLAFSAEGYADIAKWKYHLFLALSLCFVFLVTEQLVISAKPERRKPFLTDGFSIFLGFYFLFTMLSGLISEYPCVFWGGSRHDGILTIGLYIACTLLLRQYFTPKKWMLFMFAASVSLFCLLGIVQLTGENPFHLYPQNFNYYDAGIYYAGQYWSTIGNTNLCAALLSVAIGTFSATLIRAKKHKDWIFHLPLQLSVFSVLELGSEAGMAAMLAGLLLLPLFTIDGRKTLRNLFLVYASIMLAVAGSFFTIFYDGGMTFESNAKGYALCAVALLFVFCGVLLEQTNVFQHTTSCRRRLRKKLAAFTAGIFLLGLLMLYFCEVLPNGFLAQAHELLHGRWDDSFGSNRLYIWRQVWAAVLEKPFFGGGPDTLAMRGLSGFSRYNEAIGRTVTSTIDAAHNEYLNILVNQGAFALFSYLAAIGISLVKWWQTPYDSAAVAGAAMLFYLIQACFGISMCLTAPCLWLAMAVLNQER